MSKITKTRLEKEVKALGKKCLKTRHTYYNTGYTMPVEIPYSIQRKYFKKSFLQDPRTIDEQVKNWTEIWNSTNYFDALTQACFFLDYNRDRLELKHWKILKTWSQKVDNWVHSDSLSGIYALLHEQYPSDIYPTFQKWNKRKEPWLQRLSIVSLFYYSSLRKKRQPSFTKVTKLLLPLLDIKHYYVQKGVGWTFRELYNVYPDKTYNLLTKHIKVLSSDAWQAATEKLSTQQKNKLKKIRKSAKTPNH